ncbi:hypothetical protein [Nonomuraea jiangxiensis]|uniref:hypothetical protein n=1 Tax=Nonomuraea jiangxiensis TaxID=633440 RepID=UPI000B88DABE|nr:hypothetical protein [Nonomuraea jiangxiensis]
MPLWAIGVAPAVPPGDFASSFETADPQPAASTVEVSANGSPVKGNLAGSSASVLPGSLGELFTSSPAPRGHVDPSSTETEAATVSRRRHLNVSPTLPAAVPSALVTCAARAA